MGRFVEKKGFHVLIDALGRLRGSGVPFRAIIAGAGDEAAALKRLAHERGLDTVVTFPGWQDDTASFFSRDRHFFCLLSLHEPFGIVVLEAMAMELPVIATDSEGPSEIIQDGKDGMIVRKADPPALTAAIERMLGDRETARALGRAGYATARETYSPSRLSMLARPGRPRGSGLGQSPAQGFAGAERRNGEIAVADLAGHRGGFAAQRDPRASLTGSR